MLSNVIFLQKNRLPWSREEVATEGQRRPISFSKDNLCDLCCHYRNEEKVSAGSSTLLSRGSTEPRWALSCGNPAQGNRMKLCWVTEDCFQKSLDRCGFQDNMLKILGGWEFPSRHSWWEKTLEPGSFKVGNLMETCQPSYAWIKKMSLSDLFIFIWLCMLPEHSLGAGTSASLQYCCVQGWFRALPTSETDWKLRCCPV